MLAVQDRLADALDEDEDLVDVLVDLVTDLATRRDAHHTIWLCSPVERTVTRRTSCAALLGDVEIEHGITSSFGPDDDAPIPIGRRKCRTARMAGGAWRPRIGRGWICTNAAGTRSVIAMQLCCIFMVDWQGVADDAALKVPI